jgi:hypothetical protein
VEGLAPVTQLDLFGAVERAEAARAEWVARFERAGWVAPHDCADGTPRGAVKPGWRCPDPDCAQVEPTAFALAINHGWDPDVPGHAPFDGHCHRLRLLAAQARHDG